MVCGGGCWTSVLLWTSVVVLGLQGQSVDDRRSVKTPQHLVLQSQSMSDEETKFILNRKKVSLKSLNRLGLRYSLSSVPHVAVLASGGGQRAAVGLVGSLYQMEKDGLLDSVLYLGGVSGSAWSMSSLYSDPQWSRDMDRAVSRLSGPGVGPEEAVAWLGKRVKEEDFSLSDIWGVVTSAAIIKQLNVQRLSNISLNVLNPYPIYNAVDRNCLRRGPQRGKWFEFTPHKSGFTDLGLFVNTSLLGSSLHAGGQRSEMDMVRLQGIVGSALAEEHTLFNFLPDRLRATDENLLLDVVFLWTEVPEQVSGLGDVLDRYMRGYHSLLKLTEIIRRNTKDPAVLSDLDQLQKMMRGKLNLNPLATFEKKSPEQRDKILEEWHQQMLAPLQNWTQSLEDGPDKDNILLLVDKVLPLIWKWEWGTTKNFLHEFPDSSVPSCISLKENLQLIDAGVMINTPYPPVLGDKRDMDLLIALDYGADEAFRTLTLARDYAAELKKPFPEIDEKILEERDWPKDIYVFEGKEKEPTIVYLPLFNRQNCKDAEEVQAKMSEFSTFQLPFSQEKIESVLETAKENMKRNRETLLREFKKAALRRLHRSRLSGGKRLNLKRFTSWKPRGDTERKP